MSILLEPLTSSLATSACCKALGWANNIRFLIVSVILSYPQSFLCWLLGVPPSTGQAHSLCSQNISSWKAGYEPGGPPPAVTFSIVGKSKQCTLVDTDLPRTTLVSLPCKCSPIHAIHVLDASGACGELRYTWLLYLIQSKC